MILDVSKWLQMIENAPKLHGQNRITPVRLECNPITQRSSVRIWPPLPTFEGVSRFWSIQIRETPFLMKPPSKQGAVLFY